MARKRYSGEAVLKLLREIELKLADGDDVRTACRSVGVSDATYSIWRRRFAGMGKSQLSELRGLEKENARLRKIVAELELDKLLLKESPNHLMPRAWRRANFVRLSFIRDRSSPALNAGPAR